MIIDELKEQLKALDPDIETIKTCWQNSNMEKEYAELEPQTKQDDFWKHPQQAEIYKKLQRIRALREQCQAIFRAQREYNEFIDLFAQDEEELRKISRDIKELRASVASCKVSLLLSNPEDSSACFLNINAGAGGTESQDWANIILRMFTRFCEIEKFKVDVLDYQTGEAAGIKSATLYIRGPNAYGLLKSEHGIHRLVRISPFDANKRRHTSFAAVSVTPEVPEISVEINPADLRIDTFRAGGAGGQHVNRTESAIRITHIPSGIVVQCQNERSQGQNKEIAMKMLYAKYAQKLKDEQEAKLSSGVEKKKIEWGSQIRSYVLHPYKMVKDHRTDHESPQPDMVLDGHLMDFIEAFLVWQRSA